MNIIDKIKSAAAANGLTLNISGSRKTKVRFGKVLEDPCKIITLASGNKETFLSLFAHLIQTKSNVLYRTDIGGYTASFIEDGLKLEMKHNCNGFTFLCVYKN